MTFEVQIEDSFDFGKQYVRCEARRRVSISSDQEVTPDVLAAALRDTKISLSSGISINELDFLDQEDQNRARQNHELVERIVTISSAILSAVPSIFDKMTGMGFLSSLQHFPQQPSYSYWSNGTLTTLPQFDAGNESGSYTSQYLFVDRDHHGITLTAIFDLHVSSILEPFKNGEIVNRVEIATSEDSSSMIFKGQRNISYPDTSQTK